VTANEVRQAFVEFYLARGHHLVESAPLAPPDDPSLLFTSAGMVQFKKYYAGSVPLPYRRAVSVQKCLRGTDIDEVGRTPRHNTFFEMLGHFSFGDYFKKEAILWNWELFTQVYGIDPDRLAASVYEDDDEAYEIWRREIGLPQSRIVRLGSDDNFWGPAGGTGACGPCSELYYDLGPELDPEHPDVRPGDETDRFVEVGNFVFPQFDRQADGRDRPLKNRGIDTGIGFERLVMVVQGKTTIFHTDLFWPLVTRAVEICGKPYEGSEIAYHIIADHIRALTFALGEGVLPANEGRGYVIRRLLRRAAVQGYNLGMREPFLCQLVEPVVETMRAAYPEVAEGRERTVLVLQKEEERFGATLKQGLARLEAAFDEVVRREEAALSGEDAFLLYDTYGLPLDVIRDMATGRELSVDEEGFAHAMNAQKERSRASAVFHHETEMLEWQVVSAGGDSEFLGYETTRADVRVRRLATLPDNPQDLLVLLDQTPFYGEAGGQVGDIGVLRSDGLSLCVVDTVREGSEIRHIVSLGRGDAAGEQNAGSGQVLVRDREAALRALSNCSAVWEAAVDGGRRDAIQRHHTATHLLHAALRSVLGKHVAQGGSLVAPERLRFDFTHFSALSAAERDQVERITNEGILADTPVETHYSTYEEALRDGVTALFGEKYEIGRVRRVRVGQVSEELCGGTHVRSTGEIGAFLIIEESAVSAGVRRIEAVCGLAALREVQQMRERSNRVRRSLGTTAEEAPGKVAGLVEEIVRLRKQLTRVRRGEGVSDLDALLAGAETVGEARFLVGEVRVDSVGELRELGDRVRGRLGTGGAVLWGRIGEKSTFLAVVTDDLAQVGRLKADEIVRRVAAVTGGSGGGKAHMALGGAHDRSKVEAAVAEAERLLRSALEGC
jgi:alanyl-tRNA synthetase